MPKGPIYLSMGGRDREMGWKWVKIGVIIRVLAPPPLPSLVASCQKFGHVEMGEVMGLQWVEMGTRVKWGRKWALMGVWQVWVVGMGCADGNGYVGWIWVRGGNGAWKWVK